MRPFKVIREKCPLHEGLTVLKFIGSLDAERVSDIGDQVNAAIELGRYFLVAEMSEVSFISSPALGELMGCKKRLIENNGNLYLVGLSTENRNKLRLMGVGRIFDFLPTLGAAVRKFTWDNENKGDLVRTVLPAALGVVPDLRYFFSQIVGLKGYSKRDTFRIEAIIDELCNNGIEHGDGGQPIEISCRIYQYHIDISVMNTRSGVSLSPEAIEEIRTRIEGKNSFNLNEKRGRGIELVRMLSHEFSVDFVGAKTIIRVIKKKEV
ncbi:MAG: hypothetical protein A2293_11930 [Elusimicrobia bacterium RIFOXYB2_FULL_49_7]|nr:MAG: hypothetical protein A2293_11930 [Elusimicrobia bacterium RIFOXYB2_FULL_49_7]